MTTAEAAGSYQVYCGKKVLNTHQYTVSDKTVGYGFCGKHSAGPPSGTGTRNNIGHQNHLTLAKALYYGYHKSKGSGLANNATGKTNQFTSNGAVVVVANGDWYVADASKLNPYAGTWFTGLAPEDTVWDKTEGAKSYIEEFINQYRHM